jgi:hypothetical protein
MAIARKVSNKRRRRPHKICAQTGKTKPPRSRSRNRADEIAALGSVDLPMPDQDGAEFAPGRYQTSYRIKEFCQAERISKTFYYELRAKGLGPKEIRYGSGVVRITHAARLAWQAMMQNPPPEVQAALDALAVWRQLNARAAAARAIQSPKHQSNRKRGTRAAMAAPSPARFEEHKRKRRGQRETP